MEATESVLLEWYSTLSETWSALHPRGFLSGANSGYSSTEFTDAPQILIVRRDTGEPRRIINVFSGIGTKLYTIERTSRYSTLWCIYRYPSREQVAQIKCGLFYRSVSFIGKPGVQHRKIGQSRYLYGGLPDHKFYLNDGAPYEWNNSSKYLERIINPGAGYGEVRQRLARARLLRSLSFDWELLVDPEFDVEIALATSFISMLTEWSTLRITVPGVPTSV